MLISHYGTRAKASLWGFFLFDFFLCNRKRRTNNDIKSFVLSFKNKNLQRYKSVKRTRPGLAFVGDGCTTTCIVMTDLGRSSNGALHCATVLPFSKILPAFINLMSLADFGTTFLSIKTTHSKPQIQLVNKIQTIGNKNVTSEDFVECRRERI